MNDFLKRFDTKEKKIKALAGAGAVLVLIILLAVLMVSHNSKEEAAPEETADEILTEEEEDEEIEMPEENPDDATYDASQTAIAEEAYTGVILQETDDAGEAYINETLFIGDSNTVRYLNFNYTSLDNSIGVIGMGAGSMTTLKCVQFQGHNTMSTLPEAVSLMQPRRVVFGYGTNNLTGSVENYISSYEKGIQAIHEAYPYFDIIVNAIPPVAQKRTYTNVSMQDIDTFNTEVVKMCERNNWKFLNSSAVLKDETTGFAKSGFTDGDGLHLSKDAVDALFTYARTHALLSDTDPRPMPLKEIPKRMKTPEKLINKDPLKTGKSDADTAARQQQEQQKAAEAQAQAEAEAQRKEEEERRKEEERKEREKAEKKEREKEEKKRQEEEEARKKAEAEAQKKAEEEAKKKAEAEAQKKAEEEAKKKAEAEAQKKAEEEAKKKAEAEAQKKAEEEAKKKAEEEARKQAEEEARRKAEEEARRQAEEEARRQAEEEARRQAEEEQRRQEEEQRRQEEEQRQQEESHEEEAASEEGGE